MAFTIAMAIPKHVARTIACNRATANFLLSSPLMERLRAAPLHGIETGPRLLRATLSLGRAIRTSS
jgi:hypothetical protein